MSEDDFGNNTTEDENKVKVKAVDSKKEHIYRIIMLVCLAIFITFVLTSAFVYNTFAKKGNIKYIMLPGSSESSAVDIAIQKVRAIIDQTYIDAENIDENKMIDAAVKGYVDGLGDQYTEYMTEDEWTEYKQNAIGNYQGIGVYLSVTKDTNEIIVLTPIEESAAEKAGIQSGDIIKKINDEEYTGDQLDNATAALKGEIGGKVKLELKRGEEILTIDIIREVVRVSPISIEMLENNIGYMEMLTFDEGISEDFLAKYNQLKAQGATSLILDVRFNGGGYINGAIEILEAILPTNSILSITNSKQHGEVTTKSDAKPVIDNEFPIVILQNQYSASSTEILTGALKDHKRAVIVGTTSYGKGVLQNVYMVDGAALKITTDEFFTPNRNTINEVGIEADYVVEVDAEYVKAFSIPKEKDAQLDKAIELLSK